MMKRAQPLNLPILQLDTQVWTTAVGHYIAQWEQSVLDQWLSYCPLQLDVCVMGNAPLRIDQTEKQCLHLVQVLSEDLKPSWPEQSHSRPPWEHLPLFQKQIWVDAMDFVPLPSESMDLLVLPHVIEGDIELDQLIKEALRVVRPMGLVFVFAINPYSRWRFSEILTRVTWQSPNPQTRPFLKAAAHSQTAMSMRMKFEAEHALCTQSVFGCFQGIKHQYDHHASSDGLGRLWWPNLGAAYALSFKKIQPHAKIKRQHSQLKSLVSMTHPHPI